MKTMSAIYTKVIFIISEIFVAILSSRSVTDSMMTGPLGMMLILALGIFKLRNVPLGPLLTGLKCAQQITRLTFNLA